MTNPAWNRSSQALVPNDQHHFVYGVHYVQTASNSHVASSVPAAGFSEGSRAFLLLASHAAGVSYDLSGLT